VHATLLKHRGPDSHTASEFSSARRLGVLIWHRDELGPAVDFSGVLKFGNCQAYMEEAPM
jgi:hypothetical protein